MARESVPLTQRHNENLHPAAGFTPHRTLTKKDGRPGKSFDKGILQDSIQPGKSYEAQLGYFSSDFPYTTKA